MSYRQAFEAWHNDFYGPQDKYNPIRSLAYDSANVGLGYDDPTVQAQFCAFESASAGAAALHALCDRRFDEIAELHARIIYLEAQLLAKTELATLYAASLRKVEGDGERYRWLRAQHFPTADNPPLAQVVWKAFDDRHSSQWANMIDGNDLDAAIDAQIAASAKGE